MTEKDKLDLQYIYRDAAAKCAALPARLKDEYQQAEVERREPFPIEPLATIPASLLVTAIDAIKDPGELASIAGSQRAACATLGNRKVHVLAADVKTLLEASGLVSNAQV